MALMQGRHTLSDKPLFAVPNGKVEICPENVS